MPSLFAVPDYYSLNNERVGDSEKMEVIHLHGWVYHCYSKNFSPSVIAMALPDGLAYVGISGGPSYAVNMFVRARFYDLDGMEFSMIGNAELSRPDVKEVYEVQSHMLRSNKRVDEELVNMLANGIALVSCTDHNQDQKKLGEIFLMKKLLGVEGYE